MSSGRSSVVSAIMLTFILAAGPRSDSFCGEARSGPVERKQPREIIVDTDMGFDDARAILALLSGGVVNICAFITIEGSASIGKGTDNLIGLLESTHNGDIPVYRGYDTPGLQPPPWRNTANCLGGKGFHPPRSTAPMKGAPHALEKLIESCKEEPDYLALGLLGNLARMEITHPGSLKKIGTIWMPIKMTGKMQISGWNILSDVASAVIVLRNADNVILIDLSSADEINSSEVLSSVRGTSSAAKWIEDTMPETPAQSPHIFLYDELAAAAVIDPELIASDNKSYTLRTDADGKPGIEPSPEGNLRIASIKDPEAAINLLVELWKNPEQEDHVHMHREPISAEKLIKIFHGHLGPYVVVGYRMGSLALETTGSAGHFDISTEVFSVLKPPRSCLIDGVQLGSGCTLGKGNITVKAFDGPPYAVFTTESGERITIRLRSGIPDLIARLIEEKGVESAGKDIMEMNIEDLFTVESGEPEEP